ncbi:DNA mismatch repair protein MutT [Rhizobium altiplani]|uniref:DNA mismatch repair protein MutT n=1 Tax=Rhizobium altiplani TaxID=1864509 RepID=A0A109K2W1_9HYPH|nr:DNA mismatch repair protein MutT [Rhizobium altiplani]KWV57292.1 DNA mismatch repair protein MutT [Rhizobium altiplani]KWV59730.1 DNA mismatch repair protein MutT [Rhizobium altiplani]
MEQAGAICYRTSENSAIEVLLVASRRNGSWGIPKGCIEAGETPSVAAAREAMEEAGVRGTVSTETLGSFFYRKAGDDLSYHIKVHLLEVTETLSDFPEKQTRRLKWALLETAAKEVSHPKLRDLLFWSRGRMRPQIRESSFLISAK